MRAPTVAWLACMAAGAWAAATAQEPTLPADDADVSVLRSARDALVDAADFSAARDPAERVVEFEDEHAAGAAANDVLHLARIQAELQEFDAAETNYLRAIAMLETEGGEYSPALIAPYQALGRTYINSRRFGEAIAVLEQAQHISQRNTGLFNVEQSELIDDMTVAQLGLGNTIEARSLQLQRLDNAVRRFGADDPRVIPYHSHLGDYYDRSRLRASAREQYATVLEIQEAEFGGEDPRLLSTLRKLVQIDLLLGRGEEAKLRLAEFLERDTPAAPVERALSLAVLGDWAIVQEDIALAREYYQQAFLALARDDRAEAERFFAAPEMIDFVPPLSPVDRGTRSRPYTWGSIVLEFDLSADGRASDVLTVEANPPQIMDSAYNRRIRETHFRPRLVGGEPVPTADVRFTHYFRFYVREDEELESRGEEG